ncbi:hypothetical protein DVH24_039126 [Malus domestica]|uniref:Uncharacterized protein n=1 Tax=Malus domestica TaxID=3750 RepID=A0A498KH13_MALDO|nr:hypothetical protein DVH24_039126 [Malus domestica]
MCPGTTSCQKELLLRNGWQSFLTKVEIVEYKGNVLTKSPEKSLFPCSVKVVSFGLFYSNLPFMDFLSNSDSVSNECSLTNVQILAQWYNERISNFLITFLFV